MRWPKLFVRCTAPFALLTMLGCSRLVDSFVYFPDRTLSGSPGAVGLAYEDVLFSAADGVELNGWWVPGSQSGPCLVFFHGNAGNLSDRLDVLRRLHDRLGLGVFLFDYRGYGRSSGRPSEKGLYADGRGARTLIRERGWDREGVVLYGRSLGAAVAIHSAAEDPPSALVVEAAFTSLADMARTHYPLLAGLVSPWLEGMYDNLAKIRRVTVPTLFLHGDQDEVAPIGMGWRLYDRCAEPKRFRTIPGAGHEDPAFVGGTAYWDAWKQLLDQARRPDRSAPGAGSARTPISDGG